MTCYLVRHGKDDESVRGGWSNSSLTTEGRRQVECLAEKIKAEKSIDIGMIYTSDLQRAMETAEILSSELVVPFVCVSDFREVNNGIFSGMSNQMASEKYPHLYWNILDWDEAYPQGESPHQFYKRIYKAWYDFKNKIRSESRDVLLVTHGGVLNVIQCIENGIVYTNRSNPFPVKNAEMISFTV